MTGKLWRTGSAALLLVTLAAAPSWPQGKDAAAQVRARFAELQAALKAKDVNRTWALLAKKSQTAAERVARSVRTAYARANPKEKARLEVALGLSGKEVAKMTAKDCLRMKRFRRKADEITGGEFRKVTIETEGAQVHFFDPEDNDTERVVFVREGGQWKAWLAIPKPLKLN